MLNEGIAGRKWVIECLGGGGGGRYVYCTTTFSIYQDLTETYLESPGILLPLYVTAIFTHPSQTVYFQLHVHVGLKKLSWQP